jgi:hypothetical protein
MGVSSDDLTDMEDVSCVSIAPRHDPRFCSVHLPSLRGSGLRPGPAPSPNASHHEELVAPPASAVMLRDEREAPQPLLRMRHVFSAGHIKEDPGVKARLTGAVPSSSEAVLSPRAASLHAAKGTGEASCLKGVSLLGTGSLCNTGTDADMLWTFLAGLLLYVATV